MRSRTSEWLAEHKTVVALVFLLLGHALLLVWGAACHSPTWDEVAHLPAGISHWESFNFDLFRVNPPLVRTVAAFPCWAAGANSGWRGSQVPTDRFDFDVGSAFFEKYQDQGLWYLTVARWACLPFSVAGGVVCWLWATRLYGQAAGLMAAALWCICPNVLGHGQLITPDVGAAALAAAAAYSFWRWLDSPGWLRALSAGMLLGLAELTKATLIVLFGVWPVLWGVWYFTSRANAEATFWPQFRQLATILLLALYVLNLGYGFEGSLTPLGEYQFLSTPLAGPREQRPDMQPWGNRFANQVWGRIPLPVPRNYLLGIDRQKSQFEQPDWSYLRGQWRSQGWYTYYLYAMLIKVPLGTQLIVLLAVIVRLVPRKLLLHGSSPSPASSQALIGQRAPTWRDELILLVPGAIVLLLVSSQTGFNRHLRYVLPVFPFLFIWSSKVTQYADFAWLACRVRQLGQRGTAGPIAPSLSTAPSGGAEGAVSGPIGRGLALLLSLLLGFAGVSSLLVYPHSLSYFNELVGGSSQGHWHLQSSNVDWGQDLYFVKRWYDEHPEARPFHYAVRMPLVSPRIAGIESEEVPSGPVLNRHGRPKTRHWPWGEVPPLGPDQPDQLQEGSLADLAPFPGWYAISLATIHERHGRYEYLTELAPVAVIGYSTHIYYISREEANRLRRQWGLPELPDESVE